MLSFFVQEVFLSQDMLFFMRMYVYPFQDLQQDQSSPSSDEFVTFRDSHHSTSDHSSSNVLASNSGSRLVSISTHKSIENGSGVSLSSSSSSTRLTSSPNHTTDAATQPTTPTNSSQCAIITRSKIGIHKPNPNYALTTLTDNV